MVLIEKFVVEHFGTLFYRFYGERKIQFVETTFLVLSVLGAYLSGLGVIEYNTGNPIHLWLQIVDIFSPHFPPYITVLV